MTAKTPFFEAVLPMPPSINDYYGNKDGQGKFVKKVAKDYRKEVYYICRLYCAETPTRSVPKYAGRIRIEIILHFDNGNQQNDIDNRLKALFDSLTYAGVWIDDSQVDICLIERGKPVVGGQVWVKLYAYTPQPRNPVKPLYAFAPTVKPVVAKKVKITPVKTNTVAVSVTAVKSTAKIGYPATR